MDGVPRSHSLLRHSMIKHLHRGRNHAPGSSHENIILFGVQSTNFLASIRVKHNEATCCGMA